MIAMDQWRLTSEELSALGRALGMHDLPETLVGRTPHPMIDERDAAMDRAAGELSAQGLIVDGVVEANLAGALKVMQRADREIAMRRVTPHGTAHVSVLRCGEAGVHVRRIGQNVHLRVVDAANTIGAAVGTMVGDLPPAREADIEPVGAPQLELAESLSRNCDARELSDRIRAVGASARGAVLLGTALATRQAFAEIVYYRMMEEAGRIRRYPAAVAVFYTARGRIVSVPSLSPAGELWTTLKPGTETTVRQAIQQLVELSDDGWEERRIDYEI